MTEPVNSKDVQAQKLWKMVSGELELQMTKATYNTWLRGSEALELNENGNGRILTIGVRNKYALDWLQNRLADTIERTASAIYGTPVTPHFVVHSNTDTADTPEEPEHHDPGEAAAKKPLAVGDDEAIEITSPESRNLPTIYPFINAKTNTGYQFSPNYAVMFWRPLLGGTAYSLYDILAAHMYNCQLKPKETDDWPSILELADMLGGGGRSAIEGRGDNPGALHILRDAGLVDWTKGETQQSRTKFVVLCRKEELPLLTPWQVLHLTKRLQKRHKVFLKRNHAYFDLKRWNAATDKSFVSKEAVR